MGWEEFKEDLLRVLVFTIYPLLELYGYFVFIGLFCLEDTKFDSWITFVLFMMYHLFIIYKVILYMRLLINEGVTTVDIFPDVPPGGYILKMKGMNKFVEESVMKQSMTKIKLCSHCKTYKPPRAHHCSTCRRCYLKYDHHCSLLDTCIGFHNYKFFFQFMVLNIVSIGFFLITIFVHMLAKDVEETHVTVNYIVAMVLFSIGFVFSMSLLIFHTWLVGMNETTIEHYILNDYISGDYSLGHIFQEGPMTSFAETTDRRVLNPYNLGLKQNWKQVFGSHPSDWAKPTYSTIGDGISFPKNYDEYELL